LRAAVEDLLGAGAILAALDPSAAVAGPCCSPEAAAARVAFLQARPRLYDTLAACGSGRKLVERGWADDVAASAALDVTDVVAELVGDEFIAVKAR
jgi:2-phosphosulfolactate phosphatase